MTPAERGVIEQAVRLSLRKTWPMAHSQQEGVIQAIAAAFDAYDVVLARRRARQRERSKEMDHAP